MYCPALVNISRAGQGTLVLISRNIIHGTKAAALVTKSYSSQDKGAISLLLAVRQISCNVGLGYIGVGGDEVLIAKLMNKPGDPPPFVP